MIFIIVIVIIITIKPSLPFHWTNLQGAGGGGEGGGARGELKGGGAPKHDVMRFAVWTKHAVYFLVSYTLLLHSSKFKQSNYVQKLCSVENPDYFNSHPDSVVHLENRIRILFLNLKRFGKNWQATKSNPLTIFFFPTLPDFQLTYFQKMFCLFNPIVRSLSSQPSVLFHGSNGYGSGNGFIFVRNLRVANHQ